MSLSSEDLKARPPPRWCLGIMNPADTDEVPGSILLMPKEVNHNEPLGLHNAPARTSASSLPSPFPPTTAAASSSSSSSAVSRRHGNHHHHRDGEVLVTKKTTSDGRIILEPQPEDSKNDPLNWAAWRRDLALLSLGWSAMIGGGMTSALAAGFTDVAATYSVTVPQVALTTGLYMTGMGVGGVFASPTAIIWGKRPVYIAASVLLVVTSVWCALSPSFPSLIAARIFQGVAVSPVEVLPSATIAEIFYLHERAYRLGIYTLLLLSGKNLIPLVSAAIIQALEWRWVFWIVAIVTGFGLCLLVLFVPETFWDRTPRPRRGHHSRSGFLSAIGNLITPDHHKDHLAALEAHAAKNPGDLEKLAGGGPSLSHQGPEAGTIAQRRKLKTARVGFADDAVASKEGDSQREMTENGERAPAEPGTREVEARPAVEAVASDDVIPGEVSLAAVADSDRLEPPRPIYEASSGPEPRGLASATTSQHSTNSAPGSPRGAAALTAHGGHGHGHEHEHDHDSVSIVSSTTVGYTRTLRDAPPKTFLQTLAPWNGRIRKDKWLHACARPFVLYAYPSILWSALVYSLSIGWLIVLSESVAVVYRDRESYNFTALQTGLVYLSPFIGGVLGTAVAGKVSDLIVRFMARRNDGVYEPEFRLVMAAPILVTTCIGLMGFGWSAQERDQWIVPTFFFGCISFGCSLGSTTAITFAVDSYRQYAGEALVTLNFSKNLFHGLVFSLFFTGWLEADGSKTVFLAIGGIQAACLLATIPMYVYGKRARMWTVRKNLMERF